MKLTKKTRIFLTALFATALLSTQPTFAATLSLPAQSLSQLHWQDVALPQQVKTELNATQKQGFTLSFAGIESPVAAYRLPASQGAMEKNAPAATAVIANQKGENEKNVKVEKETETYFNQAVLNALKQKDINRALNLVNEAEKLGLRTPRKLFLQQVSAK